MKEVHESEVRLLLPRLRNRIVGGGIIYRDQEKRGCVADPQTEEQVLRRHLTGDARDEYLMRDKIAGKRDLSHISRIMQKRFHQD